MIAALNPDLPVYHRRKGVNLQTNRGFSIEEGLSPVGSIFTQGFAQSLINHASLNTETGEYQLEA